LEFEKGPFSKSGTFACQTPRAAPDYCPDRRENEIPNECVGDLEKCWWGDGDEKPFHPSLIALAEKLGFNVERFSKIGASGIRS
jgi:hypothetical protein